MLYQRWHVSMSVKRRRRQHYNPVTVGHLEKYILGPPFFWQNGCRDCSLGEGEEMGSLLLQNLGNSELVFAVWEMENEAIFLDTVRLAARTYFFNFGKVVFRPTSPSVFLQNLTYPNFPHRILVLLLPFFFFLLSYPLNEI